MAWLTGGLPCGLSGRATSKILDKVENYNPKSFGLIAVLLQLIHDPMSRSDLQRDLGVPSIVLDGVLMQLTDDGLIARDPADDRFRLTREALDLVEAA
jgi:DNA-binding IclR family transcriptional regulator